METNHPTYLTANDVAQRLHCTTGHLANLRSARVGLPYYKVGGKCLYREADIETYLNNSRVEPVEVSA